MCLGLTVSTAKQCLQRAQGQYKIGKTSAILTVTKEKAKSCSSSRPASPIAANGVPWWGCQGATRPPGEKQLMVLLT